MIEIVLTCEMCGKEKRWKDDRIKDTVSLKLNLFDGDKNNFYTY